ncbi:CPBP family intramembrane glutamic endopeptidase [Catenuloplanes japonicus]|uniref:CPBP family intramembrane glutamic endopeptidase n=1 Tax=Catenuloplanes japonicus TaxID=33876 RepID=UPI00068C48CD|nr:CPBP family intramembrane glutamic endopeptidase [Catenuloplanes japonicus]
MIDNEDTPPHQATVRPTALRRLGQNLLRRYSVHPSSPFRHLPGPAVVPYHRISVPVPWWRTAVGTVFITAVAGIGLSLVFLLLVRQLPGQQIPVLGAGTMMAVACVGIAMYIPAVLVAARYIEGRRPGTVSSVAGRLRWPWLGLCLTAAVVSHIVFMIEMVVLVILFPPGTPSTPATAVPDRQEPWTQVLIGGAIILVLIVFQSTAEEYLYRGWLLQLIRFASPWPAIIVQTVIWTAMHGTGTAPGSVELVVYGLMMGWLTVYTGGLEAAIARHVVNNTAMISITLLVSGLTALDPSRSAADAPDWIFPAASIISNVVYMLIIAIFMTAIRQWRDTGPPAWSSGRPGSVYASGDTSSIDDHTPRPPSRGLRAPGTEADPPASADQHPPVGTPGHNRVPAGG